jgi:hypothetical protein
VACTDFGIGDLIEPIKMYKTTHTTQGVGLELRSPIYRRRIETMSASTTPSPKFPA